MNHRIVKVLPGSIGEEIGLEMGDSLISINGQEIFDRIDYEFFIAEDSLILNVLTKDGQKVDVEIEKDPEEHMGLVFETELMDNIHECANHCLFCFVDQLPSDVRNSLRLKDDDWRLSFLMGNYITLTNVSDREFNRILIRRPSPIYISVHATDPEIRCRLLGHRQAGKIMDRMQAMTDAGIKFHTQVVCCPDYNDGDVLDRTISDLADLYPQCVSLSVVPVGLTGHRNGLPKLRSVGKKDAAQLIFQIETWQNKLYNKLGTRFVFAADELYTKSGHPIPPAKSYEGYPQLENGVGLMRKFLDEFVLAFKKDNFTDICPCTVVTGYSAASYIEQMCRMVDPEEKKIHVYTVNNRYFGSTVTVAGLLTGNDIIYSLKGKDLGEKVLLPRCLLRSDESIFLDDVSLEKLKSVLKVPVEIIDVNGADFLHALKNNIVCKIRRKYD